MTLVIMLKRDSQIAYRSSAIQFRHHLDIVSLHRLHEALRYAVALWAPHRRRSGSNPISRANTRVSWALYAEPLSASHSTGDAGNASPKRRSIERSMTSCTVPLS